MADCRRRSVGSRLPDLVEPAYFQTATRAGPRLPSAPLMPLPTSNMTVASSSSAGAALTKETKSLRTDQSSCKPTALSKSHSLSKMATTLSSPRAASDFFNSLLGDPLDRPGMAKDRHLGGLGAAHRWAYKLQPHRRRTFSDRAIPALPPSSGTSSGAISHYSTPSRTFSRR